VALFSIQEVECVVFMANIFVRFGSARLGFKNICIEDELGFKRNVWGIRCFARLVQLGFGCSAVDRDGTAFE